MSAVLSLFIMKNSKEINLEIEAFVVFLLYLQGIL